MDDIGRNYLTLALNLDRHFEGVVDAYFGAKVKDPYRWLEDDNSPETKTWVEAQNEVTFAFLESIPERGAIRKRLTELWEYERYGLPSREGPWYVFGRNEGLQNQPVIYRAKDLEADPEVLLDPNTLSEDGKVALAEGGTAFTDDGRFLAWAASSGGSDWRTWRVREVATSHRAKCVASRIGSEGRGRATPYSFRRPTNW